MGIESACIPLPSEIIMPFAGYLVYLGRFNLFWAATAGAIGCNLGSIVAYWVGAKGGRPLVERYGRWVLMSHHDLDRMTLFFEKYGSITVLIARLLPVVRTFIAFPAGIAKMPQLRFHIYTFVGSWPWCFALAYAGMKLGEKWHTDPRFEQAFHRFHLGVEIVAAGRRSSGLSGRTSVGRAAERLSHRKIDRPLKAYTVSSHQTQTFRILEQSGSNHE